ncbi:MAG: YdcF family protein, partial [Pseudomonadales bacterium]|nr:YdcF family protein [Pseudomonadales bacterium]
QLGYPILVTGGSVFGEGTSEASLIAEVLEQEFSTPVSWVETESRTTLENVENSIVILKQSGVKRALVVSSTIHLRRVIPEFEDKGFEVIPAPMNFLELAWDKSWWLAFIPTSQALNQSHMVLHELMGRSVYRSLNYWAE